MNKTEMKRNVRGTNAENRGKSCETMIEKHT